MRICCGSILTAFALSSAIAAFAQTTTSAVATPAPKPKHVPAPILPFTSETKTTRVQTLANGATITEESSTVRARDGQGRSYNAETQPRHLNQPQITMSHISDTVAGTETRWSSRSNKATVIELPPAEQRHGCWTSDSGNLRYHYPLTAEQRAAAEKAAEADPPSIVRIATERPVNQKLGTDVIQGLAVHGSRTTLTIPVGQMGNDQPLVRMSESWWSDEYGIEARWIEDDPQQGKTTRELTSFEPGEPDPSLFQPPPGYEIVAEQLHQVACPQ